MGETKAIISVLTEIKDMIRNGDSFESIVKHWADKNPGASDVEIALREAYANTIEKILNVFKCVDVLKSIKERTKNYASMYSDYGEEYAKELAKVDREAIDYALSVIQGLGE